jgi:hypothetical protein
MKIFENNLFENVFGFEEKNNLKDNMKEIEIRGNIMKTPKKDYNLGQFIEVSMYWLLRETPYLDNIIKAKYHNIEEAGDVSNYMANNPNCLYQAASQFNYLEMPSPNVLPSKGVKNYPNDNTQGPAVAINTYPSTFYRNWILTKGDEKEQQMNGLRYIMKRLESTTNGKELIQWKNGYALAGKDLDRNILEILNMTQKQLDILVTDNLKVGVVHNSESVIQFRFNCNGPYYLKKEPTYTSTIWCSAIALNYSEKKEYLIPLAKSILKATYKITLLTGVKLGIKDIYLTQIGGGVFGNKMEWISEAIQEALDLVKYHDINVYSLFYNKVHPCMLNIKVI